MVVKKKHNNGFHGYRVPVIPRGPRSVRRRDLLKRTIEDSQICAFELLATVAGKLLLESEGSASSNATEGKDPSTLHNGGVKPEQLEEAKALGSECLDQESCVESVSVAGRHVESILREFPPAACDPVLESTSVISSSNFSGKVGHDLKLEIPENQASLEKSFCKVEGGSSDCGRSCDGHVDSGIARQLEDEGDRNYNVHLTTANTSNPKDEIETCVNTLPWINSDSSVQLTSFRDSVPNASFPRRRNTVKVVTRDDDEKFVRSNLPNSKIRAFKTHRIGHRRIRKLLTSKYWKVAPKLKDCEYSNTNGHIRCISRNRKIVHACERIQREGPFKKRRIFDSSSALAYDGEGSSESISNSPEKVMKGEKSGSAVNKANLPSSSAASHPSAHSKESHVKFSIKSFKVPNLYIEVSETSTVGSLKRKVMEAVTAILQGGLHIGVLLQGKEVKDDNRTLLQTGMCHNDYLDTLGFTLEPSSATASPPMSPKDSPVLLPCETQQDLTRLTVGPILDMELANASCDPPPVANVLKPVENNHELALSPTHEVTNGTTPDSRALVSIPPVSAEALAVIPLNQKSRRSELAQRRIRRPFSVSEVEALVEAVEKLGTGRWRDVKLRAFEDADHRTYVDLKDKWKTLVHTASIAPQQRRGQPVPQDLLDRVLCAHSYWSQHQSKLHGKNHTEPLKISDTPTGQV